MFTIGACKIKMLDRMVYGRCSRAFHCHGQKLEGFHPILRSKDALLLRGWNKGSGTVWRGEPEISFALGRFGSIKGIFPVLKILLSPIDAIELR